MRRGMLILAVSCAAAFLSSCASAGQESYSLESYAHSASVMESCKLTFSERIDSALGQVEFSKEDSQVVAQAVLNNLSEEEQSAFLRVAERTSTGDPPEVVLSSLRVEFSKMRFCSDLMEVQLDIFANGLNLFLQEKDVPTGQIFRRSDVATLGRQTQVEILLTIVKSAR